MCANASKRHKCGALLLSSGTTHGAGAQPPRERPPRDAAPRRRAARDAVQALRAHQHIRHKVGVRAQLPRGRQRQVAWHADAVAHVPQRGGRRAALKRRRAALAAARGAQRVRPALLGVRAHQQRVRHVPQRCRGQGQHH